MTQTNTPNPGPRPDRSPSISKDSVADVAGEPGASASGGSPTEVTGAAATGDISVVTVSDAQDRTSAGSLSAVSGVVQQGTAPAAMPVVTAGRGLPRGYRRVWAAATATAAEGTAPAGAADTTAAAEPAWVKSRRLN